jgi:hypothetical protein
MKDLKTRTVLSEHGNVPRYPLDGHMSRSGCYREVNILVYFLGIELRPYKLYPVAVLTVPFFKFIHSTCTSFPGDIKELIVETFKEKKNKLCGLSPLANYID